MDQGSVLTGAFLAKIMSIGKNVTVAYATGCTPLSCDDTDQDGDGYSVNEGDCDEAQSGVNPAASEICDLIDNNCDGLIDEGVGASFYQDADGDGFGNVSVTIISCSESAGYVGDNTDCNDADSSLSPGATELCDGIDNNCNDAADETLSDCVDGVVMNLPDDPSDVATELDATVATTLADATQFLYTGIDPIQTGVAQDTIDVTRAAVVRGLVYDDGNPLYGVTISVLNHDEYGQTISRVDGSFDLVLNGGGLVTIVYQKDGYLTTHRQVEAPWQDTVWSPDVVLKTLDTTTTSIVVAATEVQVAQGSLVSDDDGERTATVPLPEYDDLNDTDSAIKDPVCQAGSVIQCENQVLGESFNITGTPFSLVYQSDRVPGRISAYTTKIPLTDSAVLDSTFNHIQLEVTIAGQRLSEEIAAPGLNDEYTFTWDGLDGYGRMVIGSQTATIKLGYAFDLLYAIDAIPPLVSRSFGQFPGTITTTEDRARTQGTL